jgi:hypothetical protein
MGGFDGDRAAQSRIHCTKNLAHAPFAEFAFDAVWSQARPRNSYRELRLDRFRNGLYGWPVEKQTLGLPGQQRFYFAAQAGIRPRQPCRPLLGRSRLYRME